MRLHADLLKRHTHTGKKGAQTACDTSDLVTSRGFPMGIRFGGVLVSGVGGEKFPWEFDGN